MNPDISLAGPAPTRRIVFIDVLRAFAILMMLQGHFVDTTLAPVFRDPDNPIYASWKFMRGLTAPIFFTVAGLIFIFLLLRDGRPLLENERVRKGIHRGVMLIGIGYLLRINLFSLLTGYLSPWFFMLDVLHAIGFGLLALIGVYALREVLRGPLWLWYLVAGSLVFMVDPILLATDWSGLPQWLANYFTRDYGSVFTPLPWIGYCLYGGVLGCLLHARPQLAFGHLLPLSLVLAGYLVSWHSADFFIDIYRWTGWQSFHDLAWNNGLYWRLGQVFMATAIFMWVVARVRHVPPLITRIGSETLTIYCAHYVVLYGTLFGIGIAGFATQQLSPWGCAVGAAAFVTSFVLLVHYLEPIRAFLDGIPERLRLPARVRRWKWARISAAGSSVDS